MICPTIDISKYQFNFKCLLTLLSHMTGRVLLVSIDLIGHFGFRSLFFLSKFYSYPRYVAKKGEKNLFAPSWI
jgi:hypothetical protein